jgi:hypothetical protein
VPRSDHADERRNHRRQHDTGRAPHPPAPELAARATRSRNHSARQRKASEIQGATKPPGCHEIPAGARTQPNRRVRNSTASRRTKSTRETKPPLTQDNSQRRPKRRPSYGQARRAVLALSRAWRRTLSVRARPSLPGKPGSQLLQVKGSDCAWTAFNRRRSSRSPVSAAVR